MASASRRPAAPPSPGLDSSFCRSALSHDGQVASRLAVTNASKCRPHPRQAYSNKGILRVYRTSWLQARPRVNSQLPIPNAQLIPNSQLPTSELKVTSGVGRWELGVDTLARPLRREPHLSDAPGEPLDAFFDGGRKHAGEAEPELRVAGGIRIEGGTRHERDARGERAIVQRGCAQSRSEAAPEVEPAERTREADRAGRHVPL